MTKRVAAVPICHSLISPLAKTPVQAQDRRLNRASRYDYIRTSGGGAEDCFDDAGEMVGVKILWHAGAIFLTVIGISGIMRSCRHIAAAPTGRRIARQVSQDMGW